MMAKVSKLMVIVFSVFVLSLAVAVSAFAQTEEPVDGDVPAERTPPEGLENLDKEAIRSYKQEAMVEALDGIDSVEELEAAKEDGTLRDIIEAAELDREAIKASALQAALDDGVITQAEYDILVELGPRGPRGGQGGPDGERPADGEFSGEGGPRFGNRGGDGSGFGPRGGEAPADADV